MRLVGSSFAPPAQDLRPSLYSEHPEHPTPPASNSQNALPDQAGTGRGRNIREKVAPTPTPSPASAIGRVAVVCFVAPPDLQTKQGAKQGAKRETKQQARPPIHQPINQPINKERTGKERTGKNFVLPGESAYRTPQSRLEEAVALTSALSLIASHRILLSPARPRAATLLSDGQIKHVEQALRTQPVELLFVDATLSPSQQRNLEIRLKLKVLDRTGLILEIFAARARSAEGRLQVEQARLAWQRSRLVRSWTHLERQRGGGRAAAGPGEQQLELDRRMLEQKLKRTRARLVRVRRRRGEQRKQRQGAGATIALVGYANAGKSTLFNRLLALEDAHGNGNTEAPARTSLAEDRLFATLDPLMRRLALPLPVSVVLSDTVGFVSDLPHELIKAFHATLEEVERADLIVHVHDAASPARTAQAADVRAVLRTLLPKENPPPILEVENKCDLLDARTQRQAGRAGRIVLSAQSGAGVAELREQLVLALRERLDLRQADVFLPHTGGASAARVRAWLYRHGSVEARTSTDKGEYLSVFLSVGASRLLEREAGQENWLGLFWHGQGRAGDSFGNSPPP